MKRIVTIGAVALLAYAALPYWSVYRLANAFQEADRSRLEKLVDWNSLRSSIKEELSAQMVAQAASAQGDEEVGAALAAVLGPSLISGMVDGYVNAATIAKLADDARRDEGSSEGTQIPQDIASRPLDSIEWAFFSSPTEFVVDIKSEKESGDSARLIFKWHGLLWKLARIQLPDDALSSVKS
ncbi:Protein of unknown function [Cribrihabitans marinus]|uniref:DUF2939 domain-containing protein n=1 Tax=Cribrihabitans marinus TaxID=1227549 RepID=A0A1H7AFS2_9RHOB|nr:DUF2939 domain-containing protein [Cribrihabitans marinus]GGH31669.1 hypothetical protein GCM10010973_22620 [Cribrihabitans marinus]SEJ64493.1 Protein of unknown function [Cribrihabitans marinus]